MTRQAMVGVIGIGNLLAADDGAGILAVRRFSDRTGDGRVCCVESERGGLDLLDILARFEHAIVVDASLTGTRPPGRVNSCVLRRPFASASSPSLHTIGLDSVLGFGLAIGINVPDEVTVLTVEVGDIESFGGACTPEVEEAIDVLVSRITDHVRMLVPDLKIKRAVGSISAAGSEAITRTTVTGA